MTAIAGVIGLGGYEPDPAVGPRLCRTLKRFGRDGQHEAREGAALMVRTLLHSTPEDEFDRQPLVHPASRTLMAFDGRIDNRDELSRTLEIDPSDLRHMSDADVVLRAVVRWQDRAPAQLIGDFALAVWNPNAGHLWLARDPLGVRPLFWLRTERFLAFATHVSALFALEGVKPEVDQIRLHDEVALIPTRDERSFFTNVQRVMPGHMVALTPGGRHTNRRFHDFSPSQRIRFRRDEDYVVAFQEVLDRAVACRLRARGTVASHLSSGLDSSTVTAVAARVLGARGASLHAITAAPRAEFEGPVLPGWHADETDGARSVAALYPNIRHTIYRQESPTYFEGLDEMLDTLGRPPLNLWNTGWVAGISQFAASQGHEVLLTGDFGNYTISFPGWERLPTLLASGRWVALVREILALRRRYPRHRRWLVETILQPFVPGALWRRGLRARNYAPDDLALYTALAPDLSRTLDTAARARAAGLDLAGRPSRTTLHPRLLGLESSDAGEYSLQDDVAGLQSRHPLGDVRLIRFLLSIPDEQFLWRGQHQSLLRRTMEGRLSAEVLRCRTKGMQAADWFEVLVRSRRMVETRLAGLSSAPGVQSVLDVKGLLQDLDQLPDHGWDSLDVVRRYQFRLLRGLAVGAFIERFQGKD